MEGLQTQGIITAEEYQRADRAGRFTITDAIFCSYCQAPVEVRDPLQFHCGAHGRLQLRMYSNPGYPMLENETHGTMMFHFSTRPPSSVDTDGIQTHPIAEYKGCPFCNRNLSPAPERNSSRIVLLRYDNQRPNDLMEKRLSCDVCLVDFRIQLITHQSHLMTQHQLRLEPEPGHLDFAVSHVALATHSLVSDAQQQTDTDRQEHTEVPDTQQQTDADTQEHIETSDAQHLLPSRHASQHTGVKGQIWDYFIEQDITVAKTEDLLKAIGCSRVSLNNALGKLIDDGKIRRIQKGYYSRTR